MAMAGGDIGASAHRLLELVHDVGRINGFADIYEQEFTDISRRIGLLSQLFEDIRDLKGDNNAHPFSSSCLKDILGILQSAKRLLLVDPNYDSKTSPDLARKKVTFQLQCISRKLERALGNIPYDQFNISEEAREQVELVRMQLRRVTKRSGFLNPEIVSRALSKSPDKMNMPDLGNKVTGSLYIENMGKVDQQSQARVDTIPKVNCKMGQPMEQTIQELERPHSHSASSKPHTLDKADSNNEDEMGGKSSEKARKPDTSIIPDDFLCPISLELMRDPVIVTTGQTYERSFIQRWISDGNRTCPKTQQKLQNLTLTPNNVLKNLIKQWCVENNVGSPTCPLNSRIEKNDGSFKVVSGEIEAINALVRKLSSKSIENRRNATAAIRSLSKKSTENRILIAEAGAIPILVKMLTTEDVRTQENVVTCILYLSLYVNNKSLIMLAGAVPLIIQILRVGSVEATENAAAILFSLSLVNENKKIIGESGALEALIQLLQNGSSRGKKDAAAALFYLCIYKGNKSRAVRAGILVPLKQMLTESGSIMVGDALSVLSVLVNDQDCKVAMAKATIIPALVDLLVTDLSHNKENAVAILHSLCKKNAENLECISRLGAFIPLSNLAKCGTDRARRKASSLLNHLQKSQIL